MSTNDQKSLSESSSSSSSSSNQRKWNTKNLGRRVGSDMAAGFCAASMVAPLITVIDKAIMQNASGQAPLIHSLVTSCKTLIFRPHQIIFSKPFCLITLLYGGTYFTANTIDTISSVTADKPATYVSCGPAKFAASSAANVGLCLFKDATFARLFGPSGPPRAVPLPSFALFTLRDCLTIFASFNVPPLLGPVLSRQMNEELQRHVSGQTIAQFAAPATVQLLSTPLHLLGLDLYNRQGTTIGWTERWVQVKRNWAISAAARICRIVPAFGVGGVVNATVRADLMERSS
ncbi:hypothetical protein K3495_g10420 [Podosphaera aphanis]|nr:hypothetical protein K3495_g10420 [Podosphaera aphanis]